MQSLGLDKPLFEPKELPRKSKPLVKKRKATEDAEQDKDSPASKVLRASESSTLDTDIGIRRSSRNAGKKVDYTSEQQRHDALPLAYSSGVKTTENTGRLGGLSSIRKHDP